MLSEGARAIQRILPDPAVDGNHSCSGFSIVVEHASSVYRHDPSKPIEWICDRERDSGS
jgi:hypothetical protein